MKRLWAILNDSDDLLGYEEAHTEERAVREFAKKNGIPPEDAELLYAILADGVRDDVEVPGRLISALEYGAEFAFGPRESSPGEWEECEEVLARLKAKGIHPGDILGWVRVSETWDLWCPVVK